MFDKLSVNRKRTYASILLTVISILLACTVAIPVGGYFGAVFFIFGVIGSIIGLICMGILAEAGSFQLFGEGK